MDLAFLLANGECHKVKGEEGLLSASKEVSSTKFGENVQVQLVCLKDSFSVSACVFEGVTPALRVNDQQMWLFLW